MNNAVFGITMENVRKHRDIELVITERTRNYFVSEFFTETSFNLWVNLSIKDFQYWNLVKY